MSFSHFLANKTSCIPNKSYLYVGNSLSNVLSVPDQSKLLIFHVPKFMSISHCLCRSKIYYEILGLSVLFLKLLCFYSQEFLSAPPTTNLQYHTLADIYNCLFSILVSTLHMCKSSPPSAT